MDTHQLAALFGKFSAFFDAQQAYYSEVTIDPKLVSLLKSLKVKLEFYGGSTTSIELVSE
jgi:hypothetical protein